MITHVIVPHLLRTNNFDEFFHKREAALLDRIEKAMGKPIVREAVLPEKEMEVVDFETDENEAA